MGGYVIHRDEAAFDASDVENGSYFSFGFPTVHGLFTVSVSPDLKFRRGKKTCLLPSLESLT